MDLQLSNLAMHQLVEELQYLKNGFVNNVQTLENNWIKMKIHTKEFGDKQLILTPNSFFVSKKSLSAKQSPGGFSSFLKKFIYNQRIVDLTQQELDRIIKIEFPNNILIIELFAKGNLILCEKDYKIIRAFRKEEWKDRKLEQGEFYKFPSSKGINPLIETNEEFFKKINQNKKTIFGAIIDILNVSPQILEHIFNKENLNKTQNAVETQKETTIFILNKLKDVYSKKNSKIYLINNVLFTINLDNKEKGEEFESMNSALNKLLLEKLSEETKPEDKIKKKEDKDLKNLRMRETQIEEILNKGEDLQKKGEKIYNNYTKIDEIIKAIKKAQDKGLNEKEIKEKINLVIPSIIKEIDLKKNKIIINL